MLVHLKKKWCEWHCQTKFPFFLQGTIPLGHFWFHELLSDNLSGISKYWADKVLLLSNRHLIYVPKLGAVSYVRHGVSGGGSEDQTFPAPDAGTQPSSRKPLTHGHCQGKGAGTSQSSSVTTRLISSIWDGVKVSPAQWLTTRSYSYYGL